MYQSKDGTAVQSLPRTHKGPGSILGTGKQKEEDTQLHSYYFSAWSILLLDNHMLHTPYLLIVCSEVSLSEMPSLTIHKIALQTPYFSPSQTLIIL